MKWVLLLSISEGYIVVEELLKDIQGGSIVEENESLAVIVNSL